MGSRETIIRKDEQFADMEEALNSALASLEDANSRVQELLSREAPPNSSDQNGPGDVTTNSGESADIPSGGDGHA